MSQLAYNDFHDEKSSCEAAMTDNAEKRITVRVSGETWQQLRHAADLAGLSVSKLLVHAAIEQAEWITRSNEPFVLSEREADRIAEILDNPPPLGKRMAQALEKHDEAIKNGDLVTQ